MAWFYEKGFYASVVTLLLAGEIQARTVSNEQATSIEVKLEDGTRILWSNAGKWWAYTAIDKAGDTRSVVSTVGWDATAETVAGMIATYEYGAKVETVV